MEGIEILASEQVAVDYAFGWVPAIIVGFIAIIISILIFRLITSNFDLFSALYFGFFIGVFLGGITGAIFTEPVAYKTQYKVTVSDEVSINEFYEKYEVIKRDGKIFTVRERE